MVKESSCGLMVQNTQVTSSITTSKARVSMNGPMDECMRENGEIIKCMGKEFLLGEMEGDTKANMSMTKRKVMEYSSGQTAENTLANG